MATRRKNISNGNIGGTGDFKIQLASDNSGQYVDVVALDADLGITIGTVNQGAAGTEAWKVDGSGVTQPVSAAALPLPVNAAQETGGNLASIKTDADTLAGTVAGGKVKVDPSGVTSPVSIASLPLPANAAQESGGNLATLAGTVSASKVQIAGTVTANAGTNLNTSALALENGGNLATIAGAVSAGKVQTTIATALPAGSATIGAVNQGTSPWIVQQPDTRAVDQTINSASLNAAITVSLNGGEGEVGFTITGLTASGATITFEGSNNIGAASPQWAAINAVTGSTLTSTATADGSYRVEAGGRTGVRVRVSSTGTGTITISYSAAASSSLATLAQMLPPGTNTIGGVNVASALPSGQNNIGNVGGKTATITVTPTVTASNSYGTNFVVGGLLTFNNAFTSTGSGILQSVVVTIKKVETSGFTFYPFNGNPTNTTWTDAAVANINGADVSLVREPVSLATASQLGTHTVAYATGLGQAMAPGTTTLFGVLIANAALTNQFGSTSDVTVTVKILQDV